MVTTSWEEPLHPRQAAAALGWSTRREGGESAPSSPSGCPSRGEKAKEQATGTSRWFCPVPAPPTGPSVAAVPCMRPDRSSEPVNPRNSQRFWQQPQHSGSSVNTRVSSGCAPQSWLGVMGSPCPPSSGFDEIFGCCPCKLFPGVDSRGTSTGRGRLCWGCCCGVPGPGGSPKTSSPRGLPGWPPAGSPGSRVHPGVLSGVRGLSPPSGRRRRDEGRCDPRSRSSSGDSPWSLWAPTEPLAVGRAAPQPRLHPGSSARGIRVGTARCPCPELADIPSTGTTCGSPGPCPGPFPCCSLHPKAERRGSPGGVTARWPRGRAAGWGQCPARWHSPPGARTCGRSTPRLVALVALVASVAPGTRLHAQVTCWHPLVTALHPPLLSSLTPGPFPAPSPGCHLCSPPARVTPRPPPRVTFPASSPR